MADLNDDIKKYLKGELSPAEMHALEKKALNDPFLEDALEGAVHLGANAFDSDLNDLKASLGNRVAEKTGKTVSLWVWSARIAAGLLLIAVSTFVVVRLTGDKTENDLALKNEYPKAGDKDEEAAVDSSTLRDATTEPLMESAKPRATTPAPREEKENEELADVEESKPAASTGPSATAIVEDQQDEKTKAAEQLAQATEGVSQDSTLVARSEAETEAVTSEKIDTNEAVRKQLEDSDKKRVAANQPAAPSQGFISGVGASRVIRGRVVSMDGIGLPGVNVMFKNTDIGTVTDGSGNYQITVPDDNPSLVFSFIGFTSEEVAAGDKTQVDVKLNEDVSQLSEIVVMGNIADRKSDDEITETLELANPYGGRRAYKQYLEKSMQYPEQALASGVEGKVTIQFTVESSGQLSDFRVIKGIGHGCEEEVIRLVQQGPRWNPTRRNTESLRDRVKVRMKFTLPKK